MVKTHAIFFALMFFVWSSPPPVGAGAGEARETGEPALGFAQDRFASFIEGGGAETLPEAGFPTEEIDIVVLDPGHGGESAGARGSTGTLEKDLVVAIAQKVKSLVEERLGLKVVLTRTADYEVSLAERSAIANGSRGSLFISLHAGAGFRQEQEGFEVWAMAYGDRTAVGDTQGAGGAGAPSGKGKALMAPIAWDRAQEGFVSVSLEAADRIRENLAALDGGKDPAVRRAPLAVLAGVRMPAVLVEVGFLTNPEQEIRLNRPSYQDQLAGAIAQAVADFRRRRALGSAGEVLR